MFGISLPIILPHSPSPNWQIISRDNYNLFTKAPRHVLNYYRQLNHFLINWLLLVSQSMKII